MLKMFINSILQRFSKTSEPISKWNNVNMLKNVHCNHGNGRIGRNIDRSWVFIFLVVFLFVMIEVSQLILNSNCYVTKHLETFIKKNYLKTVNSTILPLGYYNLQLLSVTCTLTLPVALRR